MVFVCLFVCFFVALGVVCLFACLLVFVVVFDAKQSKCGRSVKRSWVVKHVCDRGQRAK